MTTPPDDSANFRVGTAEREAAIAALNEHWQAGRLDPTEHEARTTKAHAAVTRADLDALFTDLPGSWKPSPPARGAAAPAERSGSGSTSGTPLVSDQSFLGRRRDVVMALLPLVCLLLFFTVVRSWLVWLLIPITAIVLYGSDGGRKNRSDRP